MRSDTLGVPCSVRSRCPLAPVRRAVSVGSTRPQIGRAASAFRSGRARLVLWLLLFLSPAVSLAQASGSQQPVPEPSAAHNRSEPVPAAFEAPASWLTPIEPFALAEDVYYVGSEELASYLFTSPRGHVLIDAPMEEYAEQLLTNMRSLGFDPQDIEVVLATHGHFDHTGGLARVLEASGAELVLAPRAAELVQAGGRGDFFLGDRAPYPAARAARLLRDGEVVEVGPLRLQALFTPGHTRGCTSWSTQVRIGGVEHQAVLVCSLSVLPGYQLVGAEPSYPEIAVDFCRSVARLEALEPTVFLANHGSFLRLETKRSALNDGEITAFVDPDGYRRYLERARERIEGTLGEQAATDCSAVLATTAGR